MMRDKDKTAKKIKRYVPEYRLSERQDYKDKAHKVLTDRPFYLKGEKHE